MYIPLLLQDPRRGHDPCDNYLSLAELKKEKEKKKAWRRGMGPEGSLNRGTVAVNITPIYTQSVLFKPHVLATQIPGL